MELGLLEIFHQKLQTRKHPPGITVDKEKHVKHIVTFQNKSKQA